MGITLVVIISLLVVNSNPIHQLPIQSSLLSVIQSTQFNCKPLSINNFWYPWRFNNWTLEIFASSCCRFALINPVEGPWKLTSHLVLQFSNSSRIGTAKVTEIEWPILEAFKGLLVHGTFLKWKFNESAMWSNQNLLLIDRRFECLQFVAGICYGSVFNAHPAIIEYCHEGKFVGWLWHHLWRFKARINQIQ